MSNRLFFLFFSPHAAKEDPVTENRFLHGRKLLEKRGAANQFAAPFFSQQY